MKLILLLLGVFYIIVGKAKQIPKANIDVSDETVDFDKLNNVRDYRASHRRHKRQFSSMGSNWDRGFHVPSNYDSYQDGQIALLKDQLETLKKENYMIRSNINMSPKLVYVPVPFPVRQYISCPGKQPANNISGLNNKFGNFDEDEENALKEIWNAQEYYDGNRQISFEAKQPSRPVAAQPPVEHGTVQVGVNTEAPFIEPGPCDAFILICCNESGRAQQNCFIKNDCAQVFKTGIACHPKTIEGIIKKFVQAYAPKNA